MQKNQGATCNGCDGVQHFRVASLAGLVVNLLADGKGGTQQRAKGYGVKRAEACKGCPVGQVGAFVGWECWEWQSGFLFRVVAQ